ncbi:MAG: FAD-binding and (Fe-S)-binding domain-containing protein [ANME-2 cluster archaeon]|nr:FAD-binding and (Fe-S)-binding domain-containing protein [ANME-2 cluster archaeon]
MKAIREFNSDEQDELGALFKDRVNFERLERKMYSHDVASLPRLVKPMLGNTMPAAVVKPANEEELVELVKFARGRKIPLVPRGAATSGYGGVLPTKGGIVIDMSLLDKVTEIDEKGPSATIQAGAVWQDVEKRLNEKGLSLRVMPTSSPASTVGGWLAQGGAGLGSFAYGAFIDNVLSAKALLLDGTIKEFSGDELDTLYGAMGATGIITSVKVKVRKNEPVSVMGVQFDDPADMASILHSIHEKKLPVWSATFINPEGAKLKNKVPLRTHQGHVVEERVLLPEKYILILAYHDVGAKKGLEEVAAALRGKLLDENITEHEWDERFKSMKIKRMGPSLIPTEVVVPVNELPAFIADLDSKIKLPFLIEGIMISKTEAVIMVFMPHDERSLGFNLSFPLSLSVIKVAKEHGGRVYASGLYFSKETPDVFGERYDTIVSFKKKADPDGLLNPDKLTGKALMGTGIGLASTFESLTRPIGNLFKNKEDKAKTDKKGIPGEVVWDAYACAQCGYCVRGCTQYYGRGWESQSPRGKWFFLKEHLEGREKFEQNMITSFMVCTTCERCDVVCQLDLPVEPDWMTMRDELIGERKLMTIPPFEMMAAALQKEGNIWAGYNKDRDAWLPEDIKPKEKADIAYFAGCTASYCERDIAEGTVRLLDKAGVDFTYLGQDEQCCAIPMLVAGKWDVFRDVMKHNIDEMNKRDVKTVVTSCPACRLVWDTVYREFAEKEGIPYDFEAKHYTEVLAEKIQSGEFKFEKEINAKVTWHDSCHIGRASGIYEPPRDVIKAIPGVELVEMEHNREDALCCGSVLSLLDSPPVAAEIGNVKLEEARATGADTILALCPCCEFQMRVTKKTKGNNIQIRDLASFACEAIGFELEDPFDYSMMLWEPFFGMINLMKPEAMADLMAELLPEMMAAMPVPLRAMMQMVKIPGMDKMMALMMPKMMPMLMPMLMPKVMPAMLEAVGRRIKMPDDMKEQMPDLMPKTMENLMPNMLPLVAPLLTPRMIEYVKAH